MLYGEAGIIVRGWLKSYRVLIWIVFILLRFSRLFQFYDRATLVERKRIGKNAWESDAAAFDADAGFQESACERGCQCEILDTNCKPHILPLNLERKGMCDRILGLVWWLWVSCSAAKWWASVHQLAPSWRKQCVTSHVFNDIGQLPVDERLVVENRRGRAVISEGLWVTIYDLAMQNLLLNP